MLGSFADRNRHDAPGSEAIKEEQNFRAMPAHLTPACPKHGWDRIAGCGHPICPASRPFISPRKTGTAEVDDAKLDFRYCF
jgi:hypothetical protein